MSAAPQPSLFLLGTVRIARDHEIVDQFRSHRAVALLIYLVSQDHPVPRGELVELIWPDNPERGPANLRWALSYLKKLLPECWEITRQTAQFRPGAAWVDIDALQSALQADDPALLARACDGAEGAFCRGFFFDESPDFESWLLTQRERWRQLLSMAWERLVAHHDRPGHYNQALDYARRLLALDSWQESAQRQVMLLLARTGDYNGALARYEKCCQLLQQELGVAPQAETTALAERIRRLRTAPRHNLPLQPTRFLGREAELAQLAALLARPDNRLISIVAPGGMGKTRLAQAAAATQSSAFLEGAAFISLAPISDPGLLAATMLEALSGAGFIAPHQGHKRAEAYLLDTLAPLEMLLVLDNYEQLLPDIGLLLTLLERAPRVRLLVTSRERLSTRWERPVTIQGLPVPPAGQHPGRQRTSAVQLFLQTAERVRPGYEPGAGDLAAVDEICRQVDGMPLALELAATWVRVQSPVAIATELADNLALLNSLNQDVPPRQRSIHAVFDQTWSRLTPEGQETLARLSVFRGPFTPAAAQAVAAADWQRLAALVDRALLRRRQPADDGAGGRVLYELHELLRQYAAERLAALGLADDARQRHGRYYAALLDDFAPLLVAGDTQMATLRRMQSQIDNIRTAWEWALTARDGAGLNQMLTSIYYYYHLPALVRDGRIMMAAAAAQLAPHETLSGDLRLAYGRILDKQANFTWQLHEDYAAAEKLARESLAILESEAPGEPLARVLNNLACNVYANDIVAARAYWRRSLIIYERIGNRERQGNILRNLCVTAPTLAASRHYWEHAIALMRAAGNQRDEGHLYFIRGNCKAQAGHHEVGRDLLQRGLALIRRFEDPPHLLMSLSALAELHAELGEAARARALIEEMMALAERMAIEWHSVLTTLSQANLALAENRLDEAEAFLAEVLARAPNEGSYRQHRQHAFLYLGRLELARGAYAEARAAWQTCDGLTDGWAFLSNGRRWRSLAGIGETWLAIGDLEAATPLLRQAADVASAIGGEAAWEKSRRRLVEAYGAELPGLGALCGELSGDEPAGAAE